MTTSNVKNISFDANSGTGAMQAYTNNTTYTLPANGFTPPAGKQFKGWSVANTEKAAGNDIDVDADTTVKAVWEDITYTVNVTNGTASPSQAAAGATVTLTADAAPSGQVFDKWEVVSGVITLEDATSATTTFKMPAGAVSVKATYKAAPVTLSRIAITTPPTKATYCDDGIEYSACMHEPTPEELLERMELFYRLWNALNSLPETQGRRVDAHIILGMSYREIAKAEGVDWSSVKESVRGGLSAMRKFLKRNF